MLASATDRAVVERRGFEPLTSAVRGRGYEFEYGTGYEGPFDRFPRGGGHRETRDDSERQLAGVDSPGAC